MNRTAIRVAPVVSAVVLAGGVLWALAAGFGLRQGGSCARDWLDYLSLHAMVADSDADRPPVAGGAPEVVASSGLAGAGGVVAAAGDEGDEGGGDDEVDGGAFVVTSCSPANPWRASDLGRASRSTSASRQSTIAGWLRRRLSRCWRS